MNGGSVGGYQGILFTRDPRLPEPIFDRARRPRICRSTASIAADRIIARTARRSGTGRQAHDDTRQRRAEIGVAAGG